MNVKPHVLFCLNKWCEGRPEWGDSEYEQGFVNSLIASGLATAEQFNLDVKLRAGETDLEAKLIELCRKSRPDFLFYIECVPNVLSLKTLDIIKNQLRVPIVAVWGDSHSPHQIKRAKELEPVITFHVLTSLSSSYLRLNKADKYLYIWPPRDQNIYFDPQTQRDIEVSFVGTANKADRQKTFRYLRRKGVKLLLTGGERQIHLSVKEHAGVFQRSKITLNFSHTSHGMVIITLRAFEAVLCGALMLEDLSFETPKFFRPYVDYVPYVGRRDLLKKIRYYLAHDEERKKIAASGAQKAAKYFSGNCFWQAVIFKVLGPSYADNGAYEAISGTAGGALGWNLSWGNLSKLPRYLAWQVKTVEWVYAHAWSYWIYYKFHVYTDIKYMIIRLIKLVAKRPLLDLQTQFKNKAPASFYQSQYKPGQRPEIIHQQLRSYDDLINLPAPLVSVITPSLNLAKFLEDTIRSVGNQTFRNFEHIVIDGGSTDGSVEILKKYPHIKWISEKDSGYPDAFNKGLKMARGKYIMQCMVSDAYAHTGWMQYCVDYLGSHPEISLVCGCDQDLSEDGVAKTIKYRDPLYREFLELGDFFPYCLIKNGALQETSLCGYKDVIKNCYPSATADFSQIIDWTEFNYNFHKASYLVFLAPVVASFARKHQGQMGQRWAKVKQLKIRHKKFLKRMNNYRWRLVWGKEVPRFIDAQGWQINHSFSRARLLKNYLSYQFSWWLFKDRASRTVKRAKNLVKRLTNRP